MESISRIKDNTSLKRRRKGDIIDKDYTCVYDRLNELSDDILINILSRLTIKEAVRTSILSRRWRYLWKWFTGCLNLDNFVTVQNYKIKLREMVIFSVGRHEFASLVNQVLRSIQGHTVEELRICFDVGPIDDIYNWIKFAVEKKVRRLELDFYRFWGSRSDVGQYTFPPYIDSYSSFSSLTSLSLRNVNITREVLEHLLSYCPLLEALSVSDTECLKNLKVSGSSLKLRYLKLSYVKNLEIQAPNLIYLEFYEVSGVEKHVSFRDVPNLEEVSFGGSFCSYFMKNISWLSSFLLRVHTLKLTLLTMQWPVNKVPLHYDIPELYNLKHLEMEIYLSGDEHLLPCTAFLNASTSLYKFTLKLFDVKASAESTQSVKNRLYSSLNELTSISELELVGFQGRGIDTEFVIYVIENAGLLEKVIIDPCKPWRRGTPLESFYRECEEYQSYRRQAIQLAARLPLWKFVIS